MFDIFVPVFLALIAYEVVKETYYDLKSSLHLRKWKKENPDG